MTTHCGHSPANIISTTRTNWCAECEKMEKMMDDTKYQRITETLDVWTIDGEVNLRDGGMFPNIITLSPGEAIDLLDWILYTYLEVERPERIVPEFADDMPF